MAEEAGRQGAPEPEKASESHSQPVEQPSWRESDAPALPALMNRKRTTEKRNQEKTIRFTPTAIHLITAAAQQRGQKFAGFVGDAALAVALGKADMIGSPEDDPVRPLIEAVEAHTTALNRIGNNLNQITEAIHRGTFPDHAETVLARVEETAENSYRLIDQLLANGVPHGA
ncbi:MobC family plasmid mobilization relaxosome protein [Streptomyces murinus]|nr:plasmid mobilization relaxosome protein MobC [Streptomyces murinus]WUD09300.1 MobC family plasmid mobilization relaxosome protein [Streptomyces murinus]